MMFGIHYNIIMRRWVLILKLDSYWMTLWWWQSIFGEGMVWNTSTSGPLGSGTRLRDTIFEQCRFDTSLFLSLRMSYTGYLGGKASDC